MMKEWELPTPRGILSVTQWGPGTPRMLAIHGWLDNTASFEPLGERMAPQGLLAIDLPGHGKSFHLPTGHRYHLLDWVFDIESALDEGAFANMTIIGHSLGTAVALLLAALAPARVKRVICLDGAGPINTEPQDSFERLLKHQSEWGTVIRERALYRPLSDWVDLRIKTTRNLTGAHLRPEHAESLVRRAFSKTSEGWTPRYDTRLKAPMPTSFSLAQILSFLSSIKCQVLLLRARQGIHRPDYGWDQRVSAITHSVEKIIEGDHYFHMTHPKEVAEVIEWWQTARAL